jgi:tripartite-type tricarboxylate transporter receptor subunit TctC
MTEAGVPGFESATNYTLFAPTGIAKAQIDVLNRESNAVVQLPDFRDKLLALGIVVSGSTHEQAQARIAAEMARWAKVIKDGNIKPES